MSQHVAHAEPVDADAAVPVGQTALDLVEEFVRRFVFYPSEAARVAHVLWIAHAHLMDRWDSSPRIAFLSPEPGSGKTRALEVTEPLVPRPIHAVNVSSAYLFRKVAAPEGPPTILFDEVDTIFGPRAHDHEDLRGLLNAGHRRGATTGRAVLLPGRVGTEELPSYSAVALAGLNDLPETLMSRSVVIRMQRRTNAERIEPWRHRQHTLEAQAVAASLGTWANSVEASPASYPELPLGVEDRDADVWEPLIAVADLAGGVWPDRARAAAVALVAASKDDRRSLGIQLLADLWQIFENEGVDRISTVDLLELLNRMEEAPWADLRGRQLDARHLAKLLGPYGIKPKTIRVGDATPKGYEAADLSDAWTRYVKSSGADT